MKLSPQQKKQVALQLRAHSHDKYRSNITIAGGLVLSKFLVLPNVLRPEVMSAMQLAQWLYFNNTIYKNKSVMDMGSGTGIQGIIMALCGAKKVTFSDISKDAVGNTQQNVRKYRKLTKIEVYEGDLFCNIPAQKFDLIVFNHPFFSDGSMREQLNADFAKLKRGRLIHRFFAEAKSFLKKDGFIVMPYFHMAGQINDPAVQAPKHGYLVKERYSMKVTIGLQKGDISIYEIFS
jgi:release factor glutamine methyltransferase